MAEMVSGSAKKGRPVIVAYLGVDGACAAAAALMAREDAALVVTSARRVGRALQDLADRGGVPCEVHVCGLGVLGDWQQTAQAALALRERGSELIWYCGRGYLDDRSASFEQFCRPVFLNAGSNTACVCEHLGLSGEANATRLKGLARRDPRIGRTDGPASEEEQFRVDLIDSCIAQYLKYLDPAPYTALVSRLARWETGESDRLQVEVHRRFGLRHLLQGTSAAINELRRTIRLCAETDESVLITGETGVGKEYVAHLVHEGGRRAMELMIPVNCALFAGSAGLANSALFGHRKGAFTGAVSDRQGAFVAADGGTLFLDEVGEMPAEVQAKFLRVLEDGWVTPEGADRPERQVDVRIISATNRDVGAMIRSERFREDLYHRLDILRIHVPPLREHLEDVRVIAETAWAGPAGRAAGRRQLTEADCRELCSYDWPGNVRQLLKVLKRAACLNMTVSQAIAEDRKIGPLTAQTGQEPGGGELLPRTADGVRPLREVQRLYAVRALEACDGVWAEAARRLQIAPNTLRAHLREAASE